MRDGVIVGADPVLAAAEADAAAPPDGPADQRLTVVGGQGTAAVRGIEQEPVGTADDEMTRQADPEQGQAKPSGDLELDDRQADREANPAPEDIVEQAVGRVAVF